MSAATPEIGECRTRRVVAPDGVESVRPVERTETGWKLAGRPYAKQEGPYWLTHVEGKGFVPATRYQSELWARTTLVEL